MADERIVLSYDSADAIAAANKANKAIEANEKTAERAGAAIGKATEAQAQSIVSITDRSQAAINRIVQQAERKAALAGASPGDRLLAERNTALSRVSGDQSAINRVTAAYDKLAAAQEAAAEGGSKLAEILRNPMQAAGDAVDGIAAGLGRVGAIALAAGAGLAFAAKASFDLVASQGAAAEAVTNFADTVGISATEAYKLQIQAKLVGSSLEGLVGGYKKLAQGIQEGTAEGKKSAAAMEDIKIRIFETGGVVRPFGDLFGQIAQKIRAIEEPTARATKVVEIFGKSGISLIPLLLQFDETAAAADRAAAGINDPLLRTLAEADDAIGEVAAMWEGLKAKLAGGIIATIRFVQDINKGPLDYMDPGIGGLVNDAAAMRQKNLADANQKMLADEGAVLIRRFRETAAQTGEGLKQRLADVTSNLSAAEGKLGYGLGAEQASKQISQIQQLRAEKARLTEQVKAEAKAEQDALTTMRQREEAEKKVRQIMAQRAAGGFRVDVLKDLEAKPVSDLYEKQFKAAQKLSEDTLELESANLKTRLSQEEILTQASRDKQLAAAEGLGALTLDQKLGVEEKKAEIERDYLTKNFALKAQLLQADQDIELAKAEQSAELRAAINEKYALAGRELTIKTEAALAAAGDTAAIRSSQLIRDEAQKNFDSVKSAADGLFDTLVLRTKSWGDLFRNAVLLPALTLIKQIASTSIAGAVTGGRGAGAVPGGGIGGLVGGLLGGGGIARAGAPGGTTGFNGPVGLSGMLAQAGAPGGGGAGFGGIGGALGLNAGLLGLGGASLGLAGAFKAGQSDNRALKYSAPAIGAVSGLVGFGALAFLFPSLLAAGPAGWIAAAGIGATIGLIGAFKKRGEDKLVEKIKAVYGINVDRSFARNPLLGIIKDQFGGDIDTGIRSPVVRELLAVYRMQSNQTNAGSGLGAVNNVARGVSLSGYGGNVYQNPVALPGGSYGYGGTLPSSGPSQPFQPERPIVIENRLQIDGRDVQASVQRTNQASNGRRESAAVLSDPLLIFG